MLSRVLEQFEKAKGPLTLSEMARRLGIESSALEGMVQFLVRKGKLRQVGPDTTACDSCGLRSGCSHRLAGGLMGMARVVDRAKRGFRTTTHQG